MILFQSHSYGYYEVDILIVLYATIVYYDVASRLRINLLHLLLAVLNVDASRRLA